MPESRGERACLVGGGGIRGVVEACQDGCKKRSQNAGLGGGQVFEPTSVARLIVIFILIPFNAD